MSRLKEVPLGQHTENDVRSALAKLTEVGRHTAGGCPPRCTCLGKGGPGTDESCHRRTRPSAGIDSSKIEGEVTFLARRLQYLSRVPPSSNADLAFQRDLHSSTSYQNVSLIGLHSKSKYDVERWIFVMIWTAVQRLQL